MATEKRKWIICPACEGEGTCVNPAIDANGLSADDFYEDPDFAEEYLAGTYDIQCRACEGSGQITDDRRKKLDQAAADRRLAAMEDGDWEAYSHASDYRYGY